MPYGGVLEQATDSGTTAGREAVPCRNCGAPMADEYCPGCGQRRFRVQDRRMGHLLGEAFGALTDFDSRIWRSVRAALVQPGRIARDWIEGRRARWVSPVRLFLLANLLYFLAPALTDLSLPMHNQVRGAVYRTHAPDTCRVPATAWKCEGGGQPHSAYTAPVLDAALARERAARETRGEAFSLDAFEQRYNARSEAIGKLLVILHVPFIAAMLALVAWRSRRYYAEHFVTALGMVTFLLLFVQLVMKPVAWAYAALRGGMGASVGGMPGIAVWGLVALSVAHFAVACRRCYDSRWWTALLQGGAAFVALGATTILVYRPVQFVLALWTM